MIPRALMCLGLVAAGLFADDLEAGFRQRASDLKKSAAQQSRIDSLADRHREFVQEFRTLTIRLDNQNAYNKHLGEIVQSQDAELKALERQLASVQHTNEELFPFMGRMFTGLRDLVAVDAPFLPVERQGRLKQIEDLLHTADVSVGEKFRRIMEAYRAELEYGRNLEAYRGKLTLNETSREVEFLRVGRVGIYYRTLDGREIGYWSTGDRAWKPLAGKHRSGIDRAFRISRKETAPDMIRIPVELSRRAQP